MSGARSMRGPLLALGATGAAAIAMPALAAHLPVAGLLGLRTRLDDDRPGEVALTFDDGPQPRETARMLALLDRLDVRSTFFVLGEHVARDPGVVREMVAAGHDVQSHGYRHRDHLLRTPRQVRDDMASAAHVIGCVTGQAPTCMRPPHGVVTWATMRSARALDQELVLWSRWATDWRRSATTASVTARSTRELRGGEILLLHDADWYGLGSARVTREAVRRIVDRLRNQGLTPERLTPTPVPVPVPLASSR